MKQFDITKHKWSNLSIIQAYELKDKLFMDSSPDDYHTHSLSFNKDDAIAIAKHFGLLDEERNNIARKIQEIIDIKDMPLFDDPVRGGLILAFNSIPQSETTNNSALVEAAKSDIARGIPVHSSFGNLQGLMQASSIGRDEAQ